MTRADTSVEIHDLIAERRSPRSLDATATIENQDLLALLEAARWAPSANNLQPWRLIAGKRDDSNFNALLECLVPVPVPHALAHRVGAVEKLHKAYAALDQAPRQ